MMHNYAIVGLNHETDKNLAAFLVVYWFNGIGILSVKTTLPFFSLFFLFFFGTRNLEREMKNWEGGGARANVSA